MDRNLKDTFLATVSHELRTPLNAMLGLAQLLDSSELTPVQRSQARTILEAGRALQVVLDDVMVMTDVEQENHDDHADCDPTLAARAITHLMQPVAWQKSLALSVLSARNVPRVDLASHLVRHILYKLLDNAVKFTSSGKIEVRVAPLIQGDKPFVRFSVRDTGPGIPPELGDKLFHVPPPTSRFIRRQHGSGFGLMVVRQIVDSAGGLCGFESALGEGSTFWFTLPAIQPEFEISSQAAPATPPEGKKLLIYLDEEDANTVLDSCLSPYHNKLHFARFPAELIAMAAREHFDAAIVQGNFADMLASAPKVKLPILALMPPDLAGFRSTAARASLNWPCPSRKIYAALDEMLNPHNGLPSKRPSPAAAEVIDHAAIAALEKSVGEETLIEIFQTYVDTSFEIRKKMEQAVAQEDWPRIESLARDVIGSASGLGLATMTLSARNLSSLLRENADKPSCLTQIARLIEEGNRTRNALMALYPELKG